MIDLFEQAFPLGQARFIHFTSAQDISRAVDEFKPYSKTFIGEVMEGMEQNHSDFMDELEKLLRALKDNKAKKAWEAALYYSEDVMAVYGHLRKS